MDLKLILLESILGVITLVCLYIAIALTTFRIQLNKRVCRTQSSPRNGWQLTGVQNQTNPDQNSEEEMQESVGVMSYHSTALRRLCLISAWLVLLRCISDHLVFYLGLVKVKVSCEVIIKVSYLFVVLPLVVQYLFLWVRQKVLYLHPVLKKDSSKILRIIGWSIPVVLIVGVVVVSTLFIVDNKFIRLHDILPINETSNDTNDTKSLPINETSNDTNDTKNLPINETSNDTNICVHSRSDVLPDIKLPWIILTLATLVFQTIFLLMYAHPLVGQRTSIHILEMMQNTSEDSLYPLLKRLLLLTGVCFASDIAVFAAAFAIEDVFISNLFLDFNLLVNQICIVLTHLDWRQRLVPWKRRSTNDVEQLTETPSSVSHCDIHRTTKELSSSRSPISSTSTTVEDVFE